MSEPQTYALIAADTLVNIVLWDGETIYEPPVDEIVLLSSLPEGIQIAWVRDGLGNWSAPE